MFLGREPKVSRLSDGGVVANASDLAEAFRISALRTLDGSPVSVTPHSNLNFVKGVVYARKLVDYSVEVFTEELPDQGTVKVERVMSKEGGVSKPAYTLIITSDRDVVPELVPAG